MADVVEVDAARVAYHHRMGNQGGVVIARGRPGLRILQPAQPGGGREHVGRHPAIGRVSVDELVAGLGLCLRHHDTIVRQAALEPRRPLPLEVVLGGHHHQFQHGIVLQKEVCRHGAPAERAYSTPRRRPSTGWRGGRRAALRRRRASRGRARVQFRHGRPAVARHFDVENLRRCCNHIGHPCHGRLKVL